MKNHKINLINKLILAISVIAVLITIVLIINLSKDYSLFSGHFKIQDTGNVGDFFGGVVGSLIGLISVLLLYKTLRYQQTDIENNDISSSLQWTTDLLIKLIDDLKHKVCYQYIIHLDVELNTSDIYFKFIDERIDDIKEKTYKLSNEFKVINKLIYQEKFDESQINLLRLIVYNSLGGDFFSFINEMNDFVKNQKQFKYIKENDYLVTHFEFINHYLETIIVNSTYKNMNEIMNIINNYRAEDGISAIRPEEWIVMTKQEL